MPVKLSVCLFVCVSVIVMACSEDEPPVTRIIYEGDHAAMGPQGGTLVFERDGRLLKLDVPAGALESEVAITLSLASQDEIEAAFPTTRVPPLFGSVYHLEPAGLRFALPAKLRITYLDSDLPGVVRPQVRIMSSSKGELELLDRVEGSPESATGLVHHFSLFAVVPDPEAVPAQLFDQTGDEFMLSGVTLHSSERLRLHSMSVGAFSLAYLVEAHDIGVLETTLTLSGLAPNATIVAIDGSYRRTSPLETDASGRATYVQSLAGGIHGVWLQESVGTLIIDAAEPNGGDCTLGGRGSWDASSRTCTLLGDLFGVDLPLEIVSAQTTLDCAGHQLFQFASTTGVLVSSGTQGVAVRNCVIASSGLAGIATAFGARDVLIEDNELGGSADYRLFINMSSRVTLRRNHFAPRSFGYAINVNHSDETLIEDNIIALGAIAIGGEFARNTKVKNNIIVNDRNSAVLVIQDGGGTTIGPGNSILTPNGILLPSTTGIESFVPGGQATLTGNFIHGFETGIFLAGESPHVVSFNTMTGNTRALKVSFTATNSRVFLNDIFGNDSPQVVAFGGALALELSDQDVASPTFDKGNYWGHDCDQSEQFIAGVDGDTGLADNNPFGFRVSSFHLVDPLGIPTPSGCAQLDLTPSCRSRQASPLQTGGTCDTDGDGLLDHEEVFGADAVDPFNGAPLGHVDYPGLGANPLVKDVFVEVDYVDRSGLHLPDSFLTGQIAPTLEELLPVVEAFARHGVHLHIDLGELAPGTAFDLRDGTGSSSVIQPTDIIWLHDRRLDPANSSLSFIRFGPSCGNLYCDFDPACVEACSRDPRDVRSLFSHPARRHGFRYVVYGVLPNPGAGSQTWSLQDSIEPDDVTMTLTVSNLMAYYRCYQSPGVGEVEGLPGEPYERFIYERCARTADGGILEGVVGIEHKALGESGIDRQHPDGAKMFLIEQQTGGVNFSVGAAGLDTYQSTDPACISEGSSCTESNQCCTLLCSPLGAGTCVRDYSISSNFLTLTDFTAPSGSGELLIRGLVFMHELGHSLGLRHGGFENVPQQKPNHLSVMSYRYNNGKLKQVEPDGSETESIFDYSDGSRPDLNVANLPENLLLDEEPWQVTFVCPDLPITRGSEGIANAPIDWTCDGQFDDVCGVDATCILDCTRWSNSKECIGTELATVLKDYDEWNNLDFRGGVTGLSIDVPPTRVPPLDERPEGAPLALTIDVKPGSDENPVNIKSRGVVPVALLAGPELDVAWIEVNTIAFGPTGTEASAERCAVEDVNQDGLDDLVCHFRTQQAGLSAGVQQVVVRASLVSGLAFVGTDSIRLVP